eukprot:tig00000073_g1706.t1
MHSSVERAGACRLQLLASFLTVALLLSTAGLAAGDKTLVLKGGDEWKGRIDRSSAASSSARSFPLALHLDHGVGIDIHAAIVPAIVNMEFKVSFASVVSKYAQVPISQYNVAANWVKADRAIDKELREGFLSSINTYWQVTIVGSSASLVMLQLKVERGWIDRALDALTARATAGQPVLGDLKVDRIVRVQGTGSVVLYPAPAAPTPRPTAPPSSTISNSSGTTSSGASAGYSLGGKPPANGNIPPSSSSSNPFSPMSTTGIAIVVAAAGGGALLLAAGVARAVYVPARFLLGLASPFVVQVAPIGTPVGQDSPAKGGGASAKGEPTLSL